MLEHLYDEPQVARKAFIRPAGELRSPLLLLAPFCITFLALVCPPGSHRTWLFLPLVIATAAYGLTGSATCAFEHLSQGIIFSSAILQAFALLYSVEPERDMHLIQEKECPPPLTLRKAIWSARLLSSVRGIGWNFRSRAIGPDPTYSRFIFCMRQLAIITMCLLGMDLVMGIGTYNAFFLADVPLSELPRRVFWTTNLPTWGIWLMIQLSPAIAAFSTVALGIYEAKDWPPTLGSFLDMTTVAGFWSRYWHQFYRFYFVANAKQLARLLPSLRSDVVILFGVFLQSGLLHAALGFTWKARSLIVLFFVLQPVAILLERAVAKRVKAPRVVTVVLGITWTQSWLFGTALLLINILAQQGFFREDPLPPSWSFFGRSKAFQASEEAYIGGLLWQRYTLRPL